MIQSKDSRVTFYESNNQRTITINSPITIRYPADSVEDTLIMARFLLSNVVIQPQEDYQRNTLSQQAVAQFLSCSNQEVKTMVTQLDKYGFSGLNGQPVEELLSNEEKEI